MKIFKKLIILFILLLILFFAGMRLYVKVYGKGLIEEALASALKRSVALGKVSYHFPLSLRAQNVRVAPSSDGGNSFEAQDIVLQLSFDAVFQRQFVFDSVIFIKPLVVIEKIKKPEDIPDEEARRYGVVVPPDHSDRAATDSASDDEKNLSNDKQTGVFIKQLVFKQGRFQYTNRSIDKDFSFSMEDVYLNAEQVSLPLRAGRTDFNVSGRLVKKGNPLSGSSVQGDGWADIVQRNMEAKIEIIEADGSVGMTAQAVSENNDMQVQGEVKFQSIFMEKEKEEASDDSSAVNNLIFDALSSAGVSIGAKFSFKTKMDDFRPEQVSFSGNVVTK
jgi:hypothetical protein